MINERHFSAAFALACQTAGFVIFLAIDWRLGIAAILLQIGTNVGESLRPSGSGESER